MTHQAASIILLCGAIFHRSGELFHHFGAMAHQITAITVALRCDFHLHGATTNL
jgi:hypothetical protein